MAEAIDTPSLSDPHPEQSEHPAAPERDAILFHAFNLFLEARRGNLAIDVEDAKEELRLSSVFSDIWNNAEAVARDSSATTPLGVAVKLRFVLARFVQSDTGELAFLDSDGTDLEPEDELPYPCATIASAIRDLERMAQEAQP